MLFSVRAEPVRAYGFLSHNPSLTNLRFMTELSTVKDKAQTGPVQAGPRSGMGWPIPWASLIIAVNNMTVHDRVTFHTFLFSFAFSPKAWGTFKLSGATLGWIDLGSQLDISTIWTPLDSEFKPGWKSSLVYSTWVKPRIWYLNLITNLVSWVTGIGCLNLSPRPDL